MTTPGGSAARLIGVGVGPGDPELLTLKAARLIAEADVIFAPTRRPGGRSMALEIAAAHVDERRQDVIVLPFPERRADDAWAAVAHEIADTLRPDRLGVFLTEGDPMLFGSFGHVMTELRALERPVTVEVIPGVSSVTAAAAAAGITLTDYDDRLAIVPGTSDLVDIECDVVDFESVVILKVGSVLGALLDMLERRGLLDQAVYVRRCGWPDLQIVHDVRSLMANPPSDYFALLIVRRR
jgi:precorrin-2/cobalt-factor-2 C20-methyltransferase